MRFFFIFANLNGQMLNGSLIMLLLSISHINYWAFLLVFMNVSLDLMDSLLLDVWAYGFTKCYVVVLIFGLVITIAKMT